MRMGLGVSNYTSRVWGRREKAAWERYGTRVTLQRYNNCGSKDIYEMKTLAIKHSTG